MDSISDADILHPAHMILQLSMDTASNKLQLRDDEEQEFGENTWNLDDEIAATALLKLYNLLPQPQKQSGLPLRVLHVQSPGGICHLGNTLSQSHIFSNLKELVITTQRIASDCQMEFFKLPNLKTLGFSMIFEGDLVEASDIIKLGEGLKMLSGSSFLQALDLRLWCNFCDDDIQEAYRENIVDTLNTIYIPHLESFKMSESCMPGCGNGPSDHHDMTNIFSFLEAHPTLSHLTLDVRGTVIPESSQVLPQLHSFTGETDICVQLSAQGRRLDKLGLTFLYEGNLSETEESPTLDKLTSGNYLFLTTLDLHGLDADMWAVEIPKLRYPASANLFPSLASAFPNVVNLNIELGGCLAHYSEFIVSMTKLECLRVQEYRLHFSMEPKAVTELFPVGEYTCQIRELHLQLPRLASPWGWNTSLAILGIVVTYCIAWRLPLLIQNGESGKAKWTTTEVDALFAELEEKKLMGHQSGNGWKPATWADVVKAVTAANPEANPTEDSLYDGLRNRATGDHVVHLGRKRRTKKSSKENPETIDDPMPEAGPSNNDADTNRAPLAPLNADDTGGTAAENNSYDDELLETPTDKRTKGTGKRQRAVSEDSDNGDRTKGSRKRQKSDPTSIARRNAEAGTQLSRSVDNLSAAMLKPIVTTEDLSHVDNIIYILRDKTLLPPDPKGKLFRIVSSELSRNPGLARVFILEDDHVRRRGLLEGILEDANIEIPEDY
ncbi:hypothetical protein C8J57DRAFT_1250109 [Mycena rebaudengoi]|nr:hypothetical protein C8J57DRAFT_1250109 [Mycena rebaudengoi]